MSVDAVETNTSLQTAGIQPDQRPLTEASLGDITLEAAAAQLDADLQFVADRFPAAIKLGAAGPEHTLATTEYGDRLFGKYMGRYVIRVGSVVAYDPELRFYKDFRLNWVTRNADGPVREVFRTRPLWLADSPGPLQDLVGATHALKEAYAQLHGARSLSEGNVVDLDRYRKH